MKKYIILPVAAMLAVAANAQDFDTNPTVKIDNEKEDVHFSVGARMMSDVAYYHTDFTPMKSGAAITDARIRTSMEYKDWYFYADFGFAGGKFSQKNMFVQYTKEDGDAYHIIKGGYYNDPASMARNTSIGSYHFISRPTSANALSDGRELGITYKYVGPRFFANQGVFAENKYNNQIAGFQGVTLSGRWLYVPVNNENETFHLGVSARFAHLGTGEVEKGVALNKKLTLGSTMETYVDGTEDFLCATLPWANNSLSLNAEALYRNDKFFARGEFMYRHVTKKRDDQALFEANLGSIDSWGTLESWQGGNPLGSNTFMGGYVEAGYMIFGNPYKYNQKDALLGGLSGKSLELVARYSYTGLNDIVDGEYYSYGRDQYYPNGNIADWPATSKSIGGGNMHSVTVGANYSFNKFVQVMLNYSYHSLDRDKYMNDKNFHSVQGRLMFTF